MTDKTFPAHKMKVKTKKQVATEKWVDSYISQNGYPPTYKEIQKQFKIDASAAHARCRNFREKMRRIEGIEIYIIKIPEGISKEKMKRFYEAISYAKKILK